MAKKTTAVTKADLLSLVEKSKRMAKAARSKTASLDSELQHVFYAGEASAGGFGLGLLEKKYGKVDILGIDSKLAAAMGAHIAGFMNIGGAKLSDHLHAVGNGALGIVGYEAGKKSSLFSGIDGDIIDVATQQLSEE